MRRYFTWNQQHHEPTCPKDASSPPFNNHLSALVNTPNSLDTAASLSAPFERLAPAGELPSRAGLANCGQLAQLLNRLQTEKVKYALQLHSSPSQATIVTLPPPNDNSTTKAALQHLTSSTDNSAMNPSDMRGTQVPITLPLLPSLANRAQEQQLPAKNLDMFLASAASASSNNSCQPRSEVVVNPSASQTPMAALSFRSPPTMNGSHMMAVSPNSLAATTGNQQLMPTSGMQPSAASPGGMPSRPQVIHSTALSALLGDGIASRLNQAPLSQVSPTTNAQQDQQQTSSLMYNLLRTSGAPSLAPQGLHPQLSSAIRNQSAEQQNALLMHSLQLKLMGGNSPALQAGAQPVANTADVQNATTNAATSTLTPDALCPPTELINLPAATLINRLRSGIISSPLSVQSLEQLATQAAKPIPHSNESVDLLRFRLKEPKQWGADDVVAWLLAVARAYQIPCENFNMQRFVNTNGAMLAAMNEQDFKEYDPCYGPLFYSEFQKLLKDMGAVDEWIRTYLAMEAAGGAAALRPRSGSLDALMPQRPHIVKSQLQSSQLQELLASALVARNNATQQLNVSPNGMQLPHGEPEKRLLMPGLQLPFSGGEGGQLGVLRQLAISTQPSPSYSLQSSAGLISPVTRGVQQCVDASPPLSQPASGIVAAQSLPLRLLPPLSSSGIGTTEGSGLSPHPSVSGACSSSLRSKLKQLRKNKDGRPRKRGQHTKGNKLWEFIRDALKDPVTCPSIVRWEDTVEGVFRIVESEKLARLWGEKKRNSKMTYEKLSRAMRTYYEKEILMPVPKTGLYPKKLVYKFGPGARGWSMSPHPLPSASNSLSGVQILSNMTSAVSAQQQSVLLPRMEE